MSVPDDLSALGIDRPALRWDAARGYLAELRARSAALIDEVLISVLVCGLAEQNAERAGRPGWVNLSDYEDAKRRLEEAFRGV